MRMQGTLDLVEDDFDYRENFVEICGVDQLEKLEEPTNPLFFPLIWNLKYFPSPWNMPFWELRKYYQ